jgi:ABC-type bacteriocin/lantibiotic exporter with double-glycine peptidase domain
MSRILSVQPFQETLHQSLCGPASLKIVLAFYGVEKSEEELARLSDWDISLGVNDIGIKQAAEGLGFNVDIVSESSFEQIGAWLDRGVPVIVNWFTRGRHDYPEEAVADGHYSVVVGLDEECITLQDPEIGTVRILQRDNFMRVWFDFSGEYIDENNLILRQLIAIYR